MPATTARASTGIAGLDDILQGGFVRNRLYLIEGMPGSGKTTLALQYLMQGVKAGESVLYVTLSETIEEVRTVGESHGWNLDGVHMRELAPSEGVLDPEEQYTVFHPSEVELSETTKKILADVERLRPTRIVFDSLSELRLIAANPLRYRRQILALKQFFTGRGCTVLMLDDLSGSAGEHDNNVQSICHGALLLEHTVPTFGAQRRRISVTKYRGSAFRGGYHDYLIHRGGLQVFPRLVAAEHRRPSSGERLGSGLRAMDGLLGGGIERGTSTLITGAAGTGKSTLAALFCATAAERGECSSLFIFDESANTLYSRMAGLHVDMRKHVDAGRITVTEVDPAQLSPGEFSFLIRQAVEKHDARVVVIDSLNGYLNSMPDEQFLIVQLHEILTYLGRQGVASLLIAAQHGLISSHMSSPVDASYLADAVMLLRYFEAEGEVRQAISVVKKRGSNHERTLREFKMQNGRIEVGAPLRDYRGVLSGIPEKRPG
jgi:circadian clock protein KaiC